jgi:mRNA-degrading endonuclease RelE of RelBE toxin-antitoxin system
MKIFSRGTFDRDVATLSDTVLLIALREKIEQLEKAPDITHITGLKLLRGYQTHYRIKVITDRTSYRIGALIRGNTIWLVRFLSRKRIYQLFP